MFRIVVIFSCLVIKCWSITCPFSDQCNCTIDQTHTLISGDCLINDNVEKFNASALMIDKLTISGKFRSLADNTFLEVGHPIMKLYLQASDSKVGNSKKLSLSKMSLYTTKSPIYTAIFTGYDNVDGLSDALSNAQLLISLRFDQCQWEILKNDTFFGAKNLSTLQITNSHLRHVEEEAFEGLEDTLKTLSLEGNDLADIPSAIEDLTNLEVLYLADNLFLTIGEDVRFPAELKYIDFSDNPLTHISDVPFADMRFIKSVILDRCQLSEIPLFIKLPNVFPVLQDVQLNGNKIRNIDETFSKNTGNFDLMTQLPGFDNNPVETIADEAFNGIQVHHDISLRNFKELHELDFDTFAFNVKKFQAQNFRLLAFVNTSGVMCDLPEYIEFSYCDRLSRLSRNFGDWLAKSKSHILNISHNGNFDCSLDHAWLAEYSFCTFHPQVIADDTFCANSNEPLMEYLSQLDYICDK